LARESATGEILSVIRSSPTDVQPVFDAVVESAALLCGVPNINIFLRDGDRLRLVAHRGPIPARSSLPLSRATAVGSSVLAGQTVHVADMQAETREFPEGSDTARRMGHRTVLCVPLIREGVAIGTIQLRRAEVQLFSARQVSLLQTFADQAIIAIENVRLFKELQARNTDLTDALARETATSEILRVISRSPTEIQPVLDSVAENAARLCAAYDAVIFRLDGDVLRRAAHSGPIPAPLGFVIPATRTRVTGRAVLDCQPVQVIDAQAKSEEFLETQSFAREHGFRTILSVPLLREGMAIGTIDLRRTEVRPFTDTQIALLQTFADQAVIAIENVRLFTELDARNRDLREALEQQTATGEVLQVISRSPTDLQPVFDTIARSAVSLCDASFGAVFQMQGDLLDLVAHDGIGDEAIGGFRSVWPMRPNTDSIIGRALLTGSIVQVEDAASDPNYRYLSVQRAVGYRTIAAVPMRRDNQAIGVISTWRLESRPFSATQIAFFRPSPTKRSSPSRTCGCSRNCSKRMKR